MSHPEDDARHEPEGEGYDGPAGLSAGDGNADGAIPVLVTLRGAVEPVSGRYRWWGRVSADDRVDALVSGQQGGPVAGARRDVVVSTPHGRATAVLREIDPWGRYRIEGAGRPPFAIQ